MSSEAEVLALIRENQAACLRALASGDMTAYSALSRDEYRLMDVWRAIRSAAA